MMEQWPKKDKREQMEIAGFIKAYARLLGIRMEVVRKSEKPDYIVRVEANNEEYGVELTSVYENDRSVPDDHMRTGLVPIPENPTQLESYKTRLVEAVQDKIRKARQGYDRPRPLILSIYMNEYISIYLSVADLKAFINQNENIFDDMQPFKCVVFWNDSGDVVFTTPGLKA